MTKIILIILSLIIIVSCSTQTVDKDQNRDNKNITLVSDTDLTFQTKKQKIRFIINDSGEIEMLKIYGDTNPQVINFYDNGYVAQLTNKKDKEEENVFYFDPTGQIYKMKTFDFDTCGGDQYLWFASSKSKSILLNYGDCHVPYVKGLQDTFKINENYTLTFETFRKSELHKTVAEIFFLKYDTTSLTIKQARPKSNELIISSKRKGTFRIMAELSQTDLPKKESGSLNKIDLNLTFK